MIKILVFYGYKIYLVSICKDKKGFFVNNYMFMQESVDVIVDFV